MSLRLRLTLLSTAILAALLLAGVGVLYFAMWRMTYAIVEDALIADTRELVSGSWFSPDEVEKPYGRGGHRPAGYSPTLFQTRALDGALLDRSSALGNQALPLSDAGLAALNAGKAWTEPAVLDGGRVLVHSRALVLRGEIVGIIQAARPLGDQERTLTALTGALAAGGALGILVAFGVSWVLVGAALRPIDRVTQAAATIGAERDFTRRVNYSGPRDEVGRLVATLNGMLTELHASYRQVAQALQAQRRFVADASHELRTPLTTVRGNLELLGREPRIAPEDERAVLADTIDEAERMMRLVNDLLTMARSDAGWRPPLAPVPIVPLAEEVRRQALVREPERPIALTSPAGVAVFGNRDMLKQVLIILVDNALTHTPRGTPVEISVALDGGAATIAVRDNGPGIDQAILPQIFERFFRADPARSAGGTGLGLSIARSLIEAQGGSIAATSRPGQGSCFTVRLPLAEPGLSASSAGSSVALSTGG
ncbi:MAG: HAMP domain-containing sensor histidine kinase [Chloroflexi bacterium OHK40]